MKFIGLMVPTIMAGVLLGCAAGEITTSAKPFDGAGLDATNWQLTAATSGPLSTLQAATEITLQFKDGFVYGNAGCNRYQAPYQVEKGRLIIDRIGMTKMLCHGEKGQVENAFVAFLEGTSTLLKADSALLLESNNALIVRFEPAAGLAE